MPEPSVYILLLGTKARLVSATGANFQGRHIKKIEIEVWYAGKKAVHEREI
jgi:hypothetical protein